ncbi:helix-turn-helix transcriptional regulator [Pseudomonas tohonis]|uniref:helix-turn-helix transcriptional regulator n=1 Tax=Pseudomonas tohonis TaxID=2725477 RepID=UPI0021D99F40|nr:helix-turn-helix transcriptional regulator [Pseudomonas tohonis]UXY50534.1 helix-turn-helix transcriptional regulator [Pseudomonas tohonis]
MTPTSAPAEFARHCLHTFTHFVPASLGAFYLIDDQLQARDFQLLGMHPHMHDAYLGHYRHVDPLQPQRCLATGLPVIPLSAGQARQDEAGNREYQGFLRDHQVIDVVEVIAQVDARPVAGLSLLRCSGMQAFSDGELASLDALQALMQAGARHLAPAASVRLDGLTPREREIALLLREGISNKQLARHLGVGLPTVKTHLLNLFRKVGASSRTELVAMLFL